MFYTQSHNYSGIVVLLGINVVHRGALTQILALVQAYKYLP